MWWWFGKLFTPLSFAFCLTTFAQATNVHWLSGPLQRMPCFWKPSKCDKSCLYGSLINSHASPLSSSTEKAVVAMDSRTHSSSSDHSIPHPHSRETTKPLFPSCLPLLCLLADVLEINKWLEWVVREEVNLEKEGKGACLICTLSN